MKHQDAYAILQNFVNEYPNSLISNLCRKAIHDGFIDTTQSHGGWTQALYQDLGLTSDKRYGVISIANRVSKYLATKQS